MKQSAIQHITVFIDNELVQRIIALFLDSKTKPLKFERNLNGIMINIKIIKTGMYLFQTHTTEDILSITLVKENNEIPEVHFLLVPDFGLLSLGTSDAPDF